MHWLKKYYINIRLKKKLMITYGALMIAIIVVMAYTSYLTMRRYFLDEAYNKTEYSLVQVINNINYRFTVYETMLSNTVWDRNLAYSLNNQYTNPADYSYEYLTNISKAFAIKENDFSKEIFEVVLYKTNDSIPNNGKTLLDMSYALQRPWYKELMKKDVEKEGIKEVIALVNKRTWNVYTQLPPTLKDYNAEQYVSIVKPIIHAGEKIVGFVEVFIKYDAIFDDSTLNKHIIGGELSLIDNHGYIVYNNVNPALVGTKSFEENTSADDSGNVKIFEGKREIVLDAVSEETDWIYRLKITKDSLLESSKSIYAISIVIAVIALLVSAGMANLIARLISSRLSKLSDKMQSIDNLDFPMDVELEGNDEIGALSRHYSNMLFRIRQLITQLHNSEKKIRDSEMKALQEQINPHFLYNTLATINWMALDKDYEGVIDTVDHLSTFYRMSLNKGRQYITIKDEEAQINAYCQIQKARIGDKIKVTQRFSEKILDYYIPKLILQPFVENAILHGAKGKKNKLNIILEGYLSGDEVVFEVIDDGVGFYRNRGLDSKPGGGYGIKNVKDKITLQYGSSFGVDIFSKYGIGTVVSIRLPLIKDDPN